MSTQQQRSFPTLTLGTVYTVDDFSVVTDLLHLSEYIDGDTHNYIDRAQATGNAISIELLDSYPSSTVDLDDGEYIPPVDDWDTARIKITPTGTDTEATTDLELTLLTDRVDLQYTLSRFSVTENSRDTPKPSPPLEAE